METSAVFGIGFGLGAVVGVGLLLIVRVFRPWLGAVSSGVRLPLGVLVGMRLRRSPVQLLVDAHVALAKRGHNVEMGVIEQVYLAHRSNIQHEQDLVTRVQDTITGGEAA